MKQNLPPKTRSIPRPKSGSIFIDPEVINSEAFHYLTTSSSIKVLLIFFSMRKMKKRKSGDKEYWDITNNGEIVFTESQAKNYGISKHPFNDAIVLLIKTGFISIDPEKGVFGENRYWLLNDWKKFDPSSPFQVVRSKHNIGKNFRFKRKMK